MRLLVSIPLVLAGIGGAPASAQVDAFRFDAERVPVGRVLEYLKTNRDGSRPGHISLYVAAADRIESLKWSPGDSTASLVIAQLDWTRFSVRRLESWVLRRGADPALRAALDTDSTGAGVRLSFLPERLLPIHAWPWHSYDFDFASLNVALAHLRRPEAPFRFERADIRYQEGGPPFADVGPVDVRFEGREVRLGVPARRYALTGPGLEGHAGLLWSAVDDGRILEFELPFPDEPGYVDGRLRLQGLRSVTATEWEDWKRSRLAASGDTTRPAP